MVRSCAVFATMSADSGIPPQQQKDIVQSFFQFDAGREATERFYGRPSAPQTPGNFSSQPPLPPMPNLPFGSETLQHLMPSMDPSVQQQGSSQSSQSTPQVLLEQQFRLNQLQQLQQLQTQIFQQQVSLMSFQAHSMPATGPPITALAIVIELTECPDYYSWRYSAVKLHFLERKHSEGRGWEIGSESNSSMVYQLRVRRAHSSLSPSLTTTIAPSGELRAQTSSDFVSPLLLQSGAGLTTMAQQPNNLPPDVSNYPSFMSQSHHMMPSAPHSAPAHIAFEISPPLSMPSGSSDFNDISPLTSPWLGPFNNSSTQTTQGQGGSAVGLKRRGASSSGDEETSDARPSRKRQSSIRSALRQGVSTQQKHAAMRGSRSANSTPLFNGLARPSMGMDVPDMHDLPGDSPSPIELPPMPPPANPSQSAPDLTSTVGGPVMTVPSNATTSVSAMTPVTPASIMNLGRIGINSALAPPGGAQEHVAPKKKDGGVRARASSKSAAFIEPGRTTRSADKAASVPLVSPSLKPIRPGKF